MKGKFYESEYEEALIDLLHAQGWEYTHGGNIARNNRETLFWMIWKPTLWKDTRT